MIRNLFHKHSLTAEEIARFHADGFVGPFRAFSEAEIAKSREIVLERVITSPSPYPVDNIQARHLDSVTVYNLCTRAAIVERLKALLGPDLIIWHSRIFDKLPATPDQQREYPWHQDSWFGGMHPYVSITAWLALTETTVENGCVDLIPGTHKMQIPMVQNPDREKDATFAGRTADPSYFDESKKVPMTLRPGEFFIFTEDTLHHSSPNLTNDRRTGLAIRVTIPVVKLEKPYPHLLLCGKDRMGFNKLIAPPTTDPDPLHLPDVCDYSLSEPLFGSGFHVPERDGSLAFRWTGPEKESWIDFRPPAQTDSVLTCRILYAIQPEVLTSLKLKVNDEPVDLSWQSVERCVEVTAKVDDRILAANTDRLRISLSVDNVMRPCDLAPENPDTRSLGLALAGISLRPI